MLRWNRLAYESLSTPDDVVVFAKGVNTRSAAAAAEVRCVYYSVHGGAAPSSSAAAAISAAQEVFRCPHPPPSPSPSPSPSLEVGAELRVSLATGAADATPIPSLASYRPPRAPPAHGSPAAPRSLICACTMVYNAAKFLGEWVAYHAAIGVERFFLYDNASDDDEEEAAAIRRLSSAGHRVSSRYWPWPKTQEAAFSHCAAAHRDACRWMAFVDVDEFVFSPDWAGSPRPNRSMLGSLLPVRPNIGQVSMGCYEFGPSGLSAHPKPGVTQGYTCRRRAAERHKSVDRSLANSVHHFSLRKGFRTRRVGTVRVNHYKYQAWDEFKVKFRRRASAFVADWSTAVNPGSRDRTPGLGFKAIEPVGWTEMFCQVQDFKLRDATRRWFGVAGPHGTYKMVWE
ncbi:LOW QUALITY PROTEIN: glycosyltransferase family 92 protein Os08g0121900-like [Ananas comosus]|uniref:Glycosyltransferase family 92 protein n=1 Tax=Ananas comosus TaxID=4615 RepID=A0A6P5H7M3_ANACO|nr:LOW QUALITY PROTEIN: glycosyltransferase family 92 protein Os08g0121900-like [Ananas comosus]